MEPVAAPPLYADEPLPAKHRQRAREVARRRRARLLGELLNGRSIRSIADEEGITPRRLREIYQDGGVPRTWFRGARTLPLLVIGGGPAGHLDRLAEELGMTPAALAELVLVIAFRRYGKIARRLLAKRLGMARRAREAAAS